MQRLLFLIGLALASTPAAALEQLECSGVNPAWTARINGAIGSFELTRRIEMTIPAANRAVNRDWPRAYTLLGRDDTAIVIVSDRACRIGEVDFAYTGDVLTQRADVPVVLTGCCVVQSAD